MKRVIATIMIVATSAALVGAPDFGSAQTASPWPTFHGNGQRNGFTNSPGPMVNTATNTWTLPQPTDSSPAVGPNGVAYIGANDGFVYALDPSLPFDPQKPNKFKWSFKTGGKVLSSPTISNDGKLVFVGSEDNSVYALDTTTGSKVWSVDIGGQVHASPLLSNDGSILYVANANGSVRAIRAADGSAAWGPVNFSSSISGSPSLSPDGSTLYVAVFGGYVFAITATGSQAGKIPANFYIAGHPGSSPAVDGNGNIYVATTDGVLQSFAPGTTTVRWSYVVPDHQPSVATPAIGNGLVIFGDENGNLYDLTASTGQPAWNSFPHTGGGIGSSAAISSNQVAYFGSSDGYIYAISTTTGGVIWQKNTGAAVRSSPAIGPDGSLWAASETGVVYRIGAISPPPVLTPPATNTAVATSTPTATATPSASPTPTGGPTTINLNQQVKPGQKQVINVKTKPNTVVRFRIDYPNGDHQSHHQTSRADGTVTYSYTQGASKRMHSRNTATVTVRVGDPPNQTTSTASYTIGFGVIDSSAEPRVQARGQIVHIYVHAPVGRQVAAYLLLPSGKFVTLFGKTGPHGFAHFRYKIPGNLKSGAKVKIIAKYRSGNPGVSTQTTFTVR